MRKGGADSLCDKCNKLYINYKARPTAIDVVLSVVESHSFGTQDNSVWLGGTVCLLNAQ